MQAQDDPFHVGGSITPSKLTLAMIVTHLVTGYACMDFLSFFAWDWSLVKGKLGCRPGAFVLYFGCRYLGILSVVSTVLFLDTFPMVFLDPLRYISEVTAGFALGLAYCIFLLRIAFMFKRLWLCILADIVKFSFLGLMIKGMTEIPAVLRDGPGVSFAQAIFGLTVTTLLFLSTLVRALYVCRQEHAFKFWACLDVCRREDVIEFGLVWASTALMSIVLFLDRDTTGFSKFTTSYLCFVVVIVTACRVYRKMLTRYDTCPARYCATLIGVRAFKRYLAGKVYRNELPTTQEQAPQDEKRLPAVYKSCLRWLLKPPSERISAEAPRRNSEDSIVPPTTHATASRSHGVHRGSKQSQQQVCAFANSRSTYAHTALYDSQDS